MQQQQDNDNYSEQETGKQKRHQTNPLNLSYEQLKERLQTLKNYNIWKQTKAKRINYREFLANQGSPIINTISSYGARYGKNEVFTDFLHNQKSEQTKSAHKDRLQSNSSLRMQKIAAQNDKPSFLSYKTNQKQKEKIQRLVNKIPQQKDNNQMYKSKKRAITQAKLNQKSQISKNNNETYHKSSPIPKQLMNLKNKLKILPSLLNRYKTEPTQINPQDENPTISIGSNTGNQVGVIKTDHLPPKSSFTIRQQVVSDLIPRKRSGYFSCIRSILSKSYDLLNGLEGSHEPDIRMSNNSYKSTISRSQQDFEHKLQSRSRYLSYWPVYAKYSISERDRTKLDKIAKKCDQLSKHEGFGNEQIGVMINLIKQQINVQQNKLNKEVLDEEKNAFSHKFDYKITLEKDKYKRNVKQLLKCKKQYRLQKQRQEIRANGIKRMKKMGQIDAKMKKLNMTKQENQNQ